MGEMFQKLTSGFEKGVNVERYESAWDVVQDCKTRKITNGRFNDMPNRYDYRMSFHGVNNYNEALELMRYGYKPVVEELRTTLTTTRTGTQKRVRTRNNVVGFAPVVPLALRGVPKAMLNKEITRIKNKVIDIYYDSGYSCFTEDSEIMENGKKMLSALIALEAQGYAVNLYVLDAFCSYNDADILCVKVKSSSQPLDLNRVSFPIAHAAFLRVIAFDWYSKNPKAKFRNNYGKPAAAVLDTKQLTALGHELFGENAVYIAGRNILDKGVEEIKEVLLHDSNN